MARSQYAVLLIVHIVSHPSIPQQHSIPLSTALGKTPAQAALTSRLYQAANDFALKGDSTHKDKDFIYSRTPTTDGRNEVSVIAIITDIATGLFVQLSGNLSTNSAWMGTPILTLAVNLCKKANIPNSVTTQSKSGTTDHGSQKYHPQPA